jgi:transposase
VLGVTVLRRVGDVTFLLIISSTNARPDPRAYMHARSCTWSLDNYAAHKHPKVRQWLDRHPRFTFQFTPTSCSWLNAVEAFFAKLAKRRLKRGVFRCVIARETGRGWSFSCP